MREIRTKKIKSKKEKNLIKLDIVFIIICLIIVKMNMQVSILGTISECFRIYNGNFIACINIIFAFLWLIVILLVIKCYVLIAIYLAFRISRMKVIKEGKKKKKLKLSFFHSFLYIYIYTELTAREFLSRKIKIKICAAKTRQEGLEKQEEDKHDNTMMQEINKLSLLLCIFILRFIKKTLVVIQIDVGI